MTSVKEPEILTRQGRLQDRIEQLENYLASEKAISIIIPPLTIDYEIDQESTLVFKALKYFITMSTTTKRQTTEFIIDYNISKTLGRKSIFAVIGDKMSVSFNVSMVSGILKLKINNSETVPVTLIANRKKI
jgi:hypothetical protein